MVIRDDEIDREYFAKAHIHGHGVETVAVRLSYSSKDPYAIRMTFGDAEWCCSRDLLLGALEGTPRGVGDVRTHGDDDFVYIELLSPGGKAMVRLHKSDAQEYATRTLEVVPHGCESDYIDVDAVVAEITLSAGGGSEDSA